MKNKTIPIDPLPDGEALYRHYTGGLRAAEIEIDQWVIEPLLENGKPIAKGYFTQAEIQKLTKDKGLHFIAFQTMGWSSGAFYSKRVPFIPNRNIHMRGPADLWGSIGSRLFSERAELLEAANPDPTLEELQSLYDQPRPEEAFAKSISNSLRSMDVNLMQIWELYHQQLLQQMHINKTSLEQYSTTQDQNLFAHVHSFFLHIGAARDYLGAFIAARTGFSIDKVDSMGRLIPKLRSNHIRSDELLTLLVNKNMLQSTPSRVDRWQSCGWLKDVSELRNNLVHKNPYGSKSIEKGGTLECIDWEMGMFGYQRTIQVAGKNFELFDVLLQHYRNCLELFQDAAEATGLDSQILTLTEKDIV